MKPEVETSGVKEVAWWEHAIRFVFGGAISVGAGLVGHHWGPAVGGLFIAFPSILPASLTLVRRHDGKRKAIEDAQGARFGAIGQAAFASSALAMTCAGWPPALVLALATLAWCATSSALWAIVYGRK